MRRDFQYELMAAEDLSLFTPVIAQELVQRMVVPFNQGFEVVRTIVGQMYELDQPDNQDVDSNEEDSQVVMGDNQHGKSTQSKGPDTDLTSTTGSIPTNATSTSTKIGDIKSGQIIDMTTSKSSTLSTMNNRQKTFSESMLGASSTSLPPMADNSPYFTIYNSIRVSQRPPEALSGSATNPKEDEKKGSSQPRSTSLLVEWQSNPVNDMVADSLIALIMSIECNPGAAKFIGVSQCCGGDDGDHCDDHGHSHEYEHRQTKHHVKEEGLKGQGIAREQNGIKDREPPIPTGVKTEDEGRSGVPSIAGYRVVKGEQVRKHVETMKPLKKSAHKKGTKGDEAKGDGSDDDDNDGNDDDGNDAVNAYETIPNKWKGGDRLNRFIAFMRDKLGDDAMIINTTRKPVATLDFTLDLLQGQLRLDNLRAECTFIDGGLTKMVKENGGNQTDLDIAQRHDKQKTTELELKIEKWAELAYSTIFPLTARPINERVREEEEKLRARIKTGAGIAVGPSAADEEEEEEMAEEENDGFAIMGGDEETSNPIPT